MSNLLTVRSRREVQTHERTAEQNVKLHDAKHVEFANRQRRLRQLSKSQKLLKTRTETQFAEQKSANADPRPLECDQGEKSKAETFRVGSQEDPEVG